MSSQDNRYDKTASWKTRRNESNSSRDSPDRYRSRNDVKRYNNYKDRRHYDNRSWKDSPYAKRCSYDPTRYRYERKAESTDDKTTQHEAERTEVVPLADIGETTNFTNKKRWNSGTSPPPKPKRPPWLLEQRPLETAGGAYDPQASTQSATNFSLIFNHINTVYSQNDPTQQDSPMSFIDRLIADEAMRMLAAASSNETTALNEPCEASEAVSIDTVTPASEVTDASSQQDPAKEGIDIKTASKVASVSAADSKLLQKSAEQVTKKLINQLSTMSRYDLKHMIDNPAGKYETALNRHAQNKLRAEVRKQLKSFGLNELGSSCVTGDGTVESDEAIDADKIPSALLEQIEQALDLNFFDITQPEQNKCNQEQVSNDNELIESRLPSVGKTVVCNKSTVKSSPDTINAKRSIDEATSSPTTAAVVAKNGNDSKASPSSTPGHRKKIIIRKPANAMIQGKNMALLPVQPNTFTLRKATIPFTDIATPSPVPIVSNNVAPIAGTTSKDTNTNGERNSVENANTIPLEANPGTRNASFLRVSTVEELNRRLDGIHGMQSVDNQPNVQEFDPTNIVPERILPNSSSIANPAADTATTKEISRPTAPCTVDGRNNAPGARQNYKSVNISTVKLIGRSTITKEALMDYITNKKDSKRIRVDQRHGGGGGSGEPGTVAEEQTATPNFADDQSKTTHVPQTMPDTTSPGQFPARKGKTPKKRKFPKKKGSAPPVVDASVSTVDNVATATQEQNPVKECNKVNTPHPATAKKGKKWKKKGKADRFKPFGSSTEHSYCAVDAFQTSPVESVAAPVLPEDISFEQHLINTYQENLNKRVDDTATKTANQQTAPKSHITIANVCTIADATETSSPTINDDTTGKVGSESQQLPQALSLMESSTSEQRDENVQNAGIPDAGIESGLPDWNLTTEPPTDSKEEIARIDTPEPPADKSIEEYILGGDSEERCVGAFIQPALPDRNAINDPQQQTQYGISNETSTPIPANNSTVSLQSLCAISDHMQSIETQTMELYNRKMQIDAMFMTLHAERMEIDQQLERLHNIRSEQINFMRLNLLELTASCNGSGGATTVSAASSNGVAASQPVNQSGQTNSSSSSSSTNSTQVGARQQERTIRRITPIGGNSVLMKIFKCRRAPSERSTEEISSVDQA